MKKQYDHVKVGDYELIKTECAYGAYYETPSILSLLGDLKGKIVLDIACGTGFSTRLIHRAGAKKTVGIDVSQKMVKLAKNIELKPELHSWSLFLSDF